MTYSKLYDLVQRHTNKLGTKWIRDQVIDITSISSVKEQWTGVLDDTSIRGFYIEGPLGPPVPLDDNEVLIVLARSLNRDWRRIVYTKELMHAFDEPDEKTDTPEKFDVQSEKFSDPSVEVSPQFRAEVKALWRALGALCPEELRLEFKSAIDNERMSEAVVAARLRIPIQFIRLLIRNDFIKNIEKIK